MKKIITSLFCILAVGLFAQANENVLINKCIDRVLEGDNATMVITAPSMDVNNDGAINITDITIMINQDLQSRNQTTNAPAKPSKLKPAKYVKTLTQADGVVVTEVFEDVPLTDSQDKK